ncbi:hypothetical protein CSAL01_13147 [Colletotrichum salicis]|uniref:MULE transposase domain-containing protein n=1 Tax=Colletotrichum salicis TaxID=1209931 RepID=A0A135RTF2_9PEZI|nr:hypothetical protein CSAL01_13147 [Colletotrichum salicis]
MWKRFPEVISFDNTYNTNHFKLPLFQATGQTCLESIYNAAFGLIDNERLEGFHFLSASIRQLIEQHSIRQPSVIITDYDKQMKTALSEQFPEVQQQLCIHHINSNVMLKAKQKWIKDPSCNSDTELSDEDRAYIDTTADQAIPHTYRGVLIMWKLVVFAETEHSFESLEKALQRVRRPTPDFAVPLSYSFGIRVTSGTESSNNYIKGYLLNDLSRLYRLVDVMQDMISDQELRFRQACAEHEVLASREHLGPRSEYLDELRAMVSSKCLGLITKRYRFALQIVLQIVPCGHYACYLSLVHASAPVPFLYVAASMAHMSGEGDPPEQGPRTCSDSHKTIPAPVLG